MRKILVLLLFLVIVVFSGCMESQKLPNETNNVTPELTVFPTEQELSLPEETSYEALVINDTFITWSMGSWSKPSDSPYFRVITNYSEWVAFLDEQGYVPGRLIFEGRFYPAGQVKPRETPIAPWKIRPRKIEPADFKEHFIIAAMMGRSHYSYPKIEIINISRIDDTVNVTVTMYKPHGGSLLTTYPYHIVIVKREVLPVGAIFNFVDAEGRLVGVIKPVVEVLYVPASVRRDANFTLRWMVSGGTSGEINYTAVHWGYRSGGVNMSDYPGASARQTGRTPQEFTADIRAPSGGRVYLRVHAIVDGVHVYTPEYQIRILTER